MIVFAFDELSTKVRGPTAARLFHLRPWASVVS